MFKSFYYKVINVTKHTFPGKKIAFIPPSNTIDHGINIFHRRECNETAK